MLDSPYDCVCYSAFHPWLVSSSNLNSGYLISPKPPKILSSITDITDRNEKYRILSHIETI